MHVYQDWVALVVSTLVVAFTVVGELKDIYLCHMAVERAGQNMSPKWITSLCVHGVALQSIAIVCYA